MINAIYKIAKGVTVKAYQVLSGKEVIKTVNTMWTLM